MSELKQQAQRTGRILRRNFFTADNVVLFGAIIFCLIWTWGSISSMSRNWSLAEELRVREQEKTLLELEVETLELENEYYLSDEYQELAARKYQNKKLPGETMVYLPANSEVALAKDAASSEDASAVIVGETSNFAEWMLFLFGIETK